MPHAEAILLTGVPMPEPNTAMASVVSHGAGVSLVYDARGPGWPTEESWAVVCFHGCVLFTCGGPNDEARHNHPMAQLAADASEIIDSPWARECCRVADKDGNPERLLARSHHYLFPFKENTFECVARDYSVIGVFPSLQSAMDEARRAVVQY